MRIIFGVGHPKHVHVRKNIVKKLIENGHEVKILAIDKDITLHLLDVYGLDYEVYGKHQKNITNKAYGMFGRIYRAFAIAKRFKPDILIGGNPYLAHVSKMLRKPHIMTTDTEHAHISYRLTSPFTDVICTPACYKGRVNPKKHVTFNGYFELAYLHPNYFTPDPSVLDDMGLRENDKFIIMRLVSWNASHDARTKGFSNEFLERSIDALKEYGDIFITSERKLGKNLERYRITFPPEKLHSALYYASLYVGDGGSVAVESAILGTPSIHVVSVKLASGKVVGASQIHGNFEELVDRYNMVYSYTDQQHAMDKALEILQCDDAKKELRKKRKKLLDDKVDTAAFMIDFIEKYPESFYKYMEQM